jgi:hypothetical protein
MNMIQSVLSKKDPTIVCMCRDIARIYLKLSKIPNADVRMVGFRFVFCSSQSDTFRHAYAVTRSIPRIWMICFVIRKYVSG